LFGGLGGGLADGGVVGETEVVVGGDVEQGAAEGVAGGGGRGAGGQFQEGAPEILAVQIIETLLERGSEALHRR
jgi:hypothetical protein